MAVIPDLIRDPRRPVNARSTAITTAAWIAGQARNDSISWIPDQVRDDSRLWMAGKVSGFLRIQQPMLQSIVRQVQLPCNVGQLLTTGDHHQQLLLAVGQAFVGQGAGGGRMQEALTIFLAPLRQDLEKMQMRLKQASIPALGFEQVGR